MAAPAGDAEHAGADGHDADALNQRISPGRVNTASVPPHAGAHVSGNRVDLVVPQAVQQLRPRRRRWRPGNGPLGPRRRSPPGRQSRVERSRTTCSGRPTGRRADSAQYPTGSWSKERPTCRIAHARTRSLPTQSSPGPIRRGDDAIRFYIDGRLPGHSFPAARARRMRRLIFPELVSGNSSTNSTSLGYLYAARLRLTWSWSSRTSASPAATPGITRT